MLWILPLFFGLFGGIIAALFAGMKYEARWWDLVVFGFVVQVLVTLFILLMVLYPFRDVLGKLFP